MLQIIWSVVGVLQALLVALFGFIAIANGDGDATLGVAIILLAAPLAALVPITVATALGRGARIEAALTESLKLQRAAERRAREAEPVETMPQSPPPLFGGGRLA